MLRLGLSLAAEADFRTVESLVLGVDVSMLAKDTKAN